MTVVFTYIFGILLTQIMILFILFEQNRVVISIKNIILY